MFRGEEHRGDLPDFFTGAAFRGDIPQHDTHQLPFLGAYVTAVASQRLQVPERHSDIFRCHAHSMTSERRSPVPFGEMGPGDAPLHRTDGTLRR